MRRRLRSRVDVNAARNSSEMGNKRALAGGSAPAPRGQRVDARRDFGGNDKRPAPLGADETSVFPPEITFAFGFCFVAGHLFRRQKIPFRKETKYERKNDKCRFRATAAECFLGDTNEPANVESCES